jgi:hypothetical protein
MEDEIMPMSVDAMQQDIAIDTPRHQETDLSVLLREVCSADMRQLTEREIQI